MTPTRMAFEYRMVAVFAYQRAATGHPSDEWYAAYTRALAMSRALLKIGDEGRQMLHGGAW